MNTDRLFALSMVLFAAHLVVAVSARAADPAAAEVDALFADYDNTASPGCSLGVIREGAWVYKRGYGMANLEYGIALSPTSVFRTGSVGKQFTAMVIAILDQQGVISLDDPLSKLFPEFPEWADEITIRHLVHHTSGIRDYLTLTWLAGMGDEAYYTDEFALHLLSKQRALNFPPGEEHLYSNSGYLLLAHIVKRATGFTLSQWAAENLFQPLGMEHSHFHDDHTHIVPNRADGYAATAEGYKISMTSLDMVGDGGVYTTVEDLLFWDRNFYDNKLGKCGQELIRRVTTPGSLDKGEELSYAFGLNVGEYRGLELISHGGSFVGFRAEMIRFPEQRLAVAVLCNRADADPEARARQVAELYLSDIMEPRPDPAETETGEISRVESARADLEDLVGHYWSSEARETRQVAFDDEKLCLVFSEESRFELIPLGNHSFAVRGLRIDTQVQFEPDATAGPQMSVFKEATDDPVRYQRFTPRELGQGEMKAYSGIYASEELGVEYLLHESEGSLVFSIEGFGAHVLEPRFDEIFTHPEYGTFEFQRGSDGAVEGLVLDAGRVQNLQFGRR